MSRRPEVLMYHAFGVRPRHLDQHNLFVSPDELERQMRFLVRWFRPIDLDRFLRGLRSGRWPPRSVVVTIDDGHASTLEVAAPLLRALGVPAVAFVCPGLLGGRTRWVESVPDEPLLTEEEVRHLPAYGIEIGAHGMDHSSLAGLDPVELRGQVNGSREALGDLLGARPRAFSYPGGRFDDAAVRAVREAGFEVGFATRRDGGPLAVPRRSVNTRDSTLLFRAKLMPGFRSVERTVRSVGLQRLAGRMLGQRPVGRPGP
jgi:peptidoglycan/xylan/chitin deacetylase (PgdA/CDA1 family)